MNKSRDNKDLKEKEENMLGPENIMLETQNNSDMALNPKFQEE